MAYRLKNVRYQGSDRKILLQNENGPCPLLAASNALLLRGAICLPSACIRNGCASLDDVVNILAEKAMEFKCNKQADLYACNSEQYVHEVLDVLPELQFGMDVNPKFTAGPTGIEFTKELTIFDILNLKMVHGWLLDPRSAELCDIIGSKTYNQLIEAIIHGDEAKAELRKLEDRLKRFESCGDNAWIVAAVPSDNDPTGIDTGKRQSAGLLRSEFDMKSEELSKRATAGSLINSFLESTGHQLTHYGLCCLHDHLSDNELCVFFRNNHFSTLTKHEGLLYLLVTDLGYANVPNLIWERIDVIDGDTEYVDAGFSSPALHAELSASAQAGDGGYALDPELTLAKRGQSEEDYHLALQLSGKMDADFPFEANSSLDEQEGSLMGAALEASLRPYHGIDDGIKSALYDIYTTQEGRDHLLAIQLQAQIENQDMHLAKQMQEAEWAQQRQPVTNNRSAAAGALDKSNCIIS